LAGHLNFLKFVVIKIAFFNQSLLSSFVFSSCSFDCLYLWLPPGHETQWLTRDRLGLAICRRRCLDLDLSQQRVHWFRFPYICQVADRFR
jgi:hypothetical protein